MRRTIRPGWAPRTRYQTVSSTRPHWVRGSFASSVAPTVVPDTVAGSAATSTALARLSFGGGVGGVVVLPAAVAGRIKTATVLAMVASLRMANLLEVGCAHRLARRQRPGHGRATVLRQTAWRAALLAGPARAGGPGGSAPCPARAP